MSRNTVVRHSPVLLVSLQVACATAPASSPGLQPARPNIIFIMADDLGYGHLGSYGQRRIKTPRLDRMAAEGQRHTQYYAGSTVCAPSRSVLMTGKHTGHTSVRDNSGGASILDEDVTVAELLRPLGYHTAITGKWGLGDIDTPGVPWKQGFDHAFGYLHQVHAHYYYPYFLWRNGEKVLYPENENDGRGTYTHDAITEEALATIRQHRKGPFFLYLPYTIPHSALEVPEDSMKTYEGMFEEPNPAPGSAHLPPQPRPRTAFAAMVSRLDRDVGRILDLLRELDIAENTIVFFTSDNGASAGGVSGEDLEFFAANGPLRGRKRDLYEGGIRVPMIAWGPGRIAAGSVSHHPWAAWDVLATLVDLAGGQVPADGDGVSVVPILDGKPQPASAFLYWESGSGRKLIQAVRHGSWKAVRVAPGAPLELYDLDVDVGETTNVAATHPDVVHRIEDYLARARTPPRVQPAAPPLYDLPMRDTGFVR